MPLGHVRPDRILAAELDDVATSAAVLSDAVAKANAPLPEDFPAEQLHELLGRLAKLPDGTADGCVGPLDAARRRLPMIRLRYILREADTPNGGEDVPPPLLRRERIDLALGELIAAVGTALATYFDRAHEEYEPQDEFTQDLPEDAEAPINAAAEASAAYASDVDAEAAKTRTAAISEYSDRLARTEQAAANEAGVIAAEARMPNPQPLLLATLNARIRDVVAIIETIYPLIDQTRDIAESARDWWGGQAQAFLSGVGSRTAALTPVIQTAVQRLQRQDDSAGTEPGLATGLEGSDYDDPEVPDDVREAAETRAREAILAGQAPTSADARLVQTLDLNHTKVADLAPLAGLEALQALRLDHTQVADLAPLAGLEALQNLYLNDTQVVDLAPLAGLQALQTLWLNDTQVADLAPLAGLQALQDLRLENTQVVDFAPVAHVPDVRGRP